MSDDSSNAADARARRLAFVKEHLRCPHCDRDLERWDAHNNPLSSFSSEYLYVCTSEECPYYRDSLERLAELGTTRGAYCFVYDPSRDWMGPMAARVPPTHRG